MINENTLDRMDSILRLIKDREKDNLLVYYSIYITPSGEGIPHKYVKQSSGGSKGFAKDIEMLKQNQKIVSISVQLFNEKGKFSGKWFENTYDLQWNIPELNQNPDSSLTTQGGLSGVHPANTQSYIDSQIAIQMNSLQRDFSFREQLMIRDNEIDKLNFQLQLKDEQILELKERLKYEQIEYQQKVDLGTQSISDMQEALDQAQKEIDELKKETEKYKTAGLGSLTDIDLKELISTAANTLATVGGSKMAKAVIAGFSGHGNSEQQMIDKAPPIEDTPYERS